MERKKTDNAINITITHNFAAFCAFGASGIIKSIFSSPTLFLNDKIQNIYTQYILYHT